jgi:hypothetical protein
MGVREQGRKGKLQRRNAFLFIFNFSLLSHTHAAFFIGKTLIVAFLRLPPSFILIMKRSGSNEEAEDKSFLSEWLESINYL